MQSTRQRQSPNRAPGRTASLIPAYADPPDSAITQWSDTLTGVGYSARLDLWTAADARGGPNSLSGAARDRLVEQLAVALAADYRAAVEPPDDGGPLEIQRLAQVH
jgi:hypothetical protein